MQDLDYKIDSCRMQIKKNELVVEEKMMENDYLQKHLDALISLREKGPNGK